MTAPNRVRATLRVMIRLAVVLLVFGLGLLLGTISSAQMGNEGGCVYDRRVYPEGHEMCQGSDLVRCDEGAWEDVGDCDEQRPGPAPISDGGDVEID